MVNVAFKDRLKSLRSERGITQEDLAQALGLPSSTIRRYESSEEGMPKNERLQMLANFFNCSVDYLLERTNEKQSENEKESDYSLPESTYEHVIREAEAKYGVNLRDDPVVNATLRELILNLAKMRKENQ